MIINNETNIHYYQQKEIAEFYDFLYTNNEDISYYLKQLKGNRKLNILVVGAGTGRIIIPLLKKKYNVTGIDSSCEMIEVAKQKMLDGGVSCDLLNLDMRDFKIKKKFDVVIIPFRTFSYNLTQKCQLETLKNVYNHMDNKGVVYLDVAFPTPINLVKYINKRREARRFWWRGKNVKYYETTYMDYAEQILSVSIEFYAGEDQIELCKKIRMIKYLYPSEIKLLSLLVGFTKCYISDGFSGEPLNNNSKNQVVELWK